MGDANAPRVYLLRSSLCFLSGKTLRIQMQLGYMDADVVVCSK